MRTEDGCIIHRCLNGERGAFGLLVDKYKEGIYAFVYDKLGSFHDAQDVTQEVFVQAYRDLHSLRRWESFVFWLYRIASTRCKLWIRTQSRRIDRDFIEDQDTRVLSNSSMDSYRDSQITESLREALDLLSENYRAVLMLHYFGGMNSSEIAKALGTSPSAIRKRLSRARAQLREEMVATMGTVFEEQRLPSGFTFRIVEAIKRIKISPMPRTAGLPWGMSLAAGLIIAILSVGTHLNLTSTEYYSSVSSLSGEPMVREIGEFPVDVLNVSDASVISSNHLTGEGLGNMPTNLQNAFFTAPQAGDTWAKKADMSEARFDLSASEVNGKIYVVGGWSEEGGYIEPVEEYDPVADKWSDKARMLPPRCGLSTCVFNGKIYAIGGWADRASIELSTVEEYDPKKDKWNRKTDMLTGRQFFSVNTVGDKIYAIGGWRNAGVLAITEEYDPEKDEWVRKADMPTARYGFSAGVVKGKIYVMGGCILGGFPMGRDGIVPVVEEYDPTTDTWTKKADMPTARMFFTASTVNGKIYAIGGSTVGSWVLTTEEYDPLADKWTEKSDIPSPRQRLSSAAANGKVYVIGGTNQKATLSTVEEYDTGFKGQSIDFKGKLPTTWGEVRTASSK